MLLEPSFPVPYPGFKNLRNWPFSLASASRCRSDARIARFCAACRHRRCFPSGTLIFGSGTVRGGRMNEPIRVMAIGAGCSHSVALLSNSMVLSWGKGEDGQLGHGDAQDRLTPSIISWLDDKHIDSVICGADFVLAHSTRSNTVYSWGWGDFGRLGHGTSSDQTIPRAITALAAVPVAKIACGDNHTLVASTTGELYAFGRNQNGQLGLGHNEDSLVPQPVTALSGREVTSIACGAEHSVASTRSHEVFAWGWGRYGNLGVGDCNDRSLPEKVQGMEGVPVAAVACGWRHSVALTADGDLWTFGWSKYGQLGHGDFVDQLRPKKIEDLAGQVQEVSGGWRHTVALTKAGQLYSWGWGKFGQLGLGDLVDRSAPTLVSGEGLSGARVATVRCGWRHTLCLTSDGRVFAWGRGVNGQLGLDSTQDKLVPTELALLSPETMDLASLRGPAVVKSDGGSMAVPDIEAAVPDNEVPDQDVPATKRLRV